MNGRLPQFLVIGAMKAGTTSLHHYLQAHPGLFLPATKELNFFRDERSFGQGVQWYRRQFADALPSQVCGEISPDYTKHPHHTGAPERIAATCPDAALVYLVRHPIERMRSMYLHQLVAGREKRPIDVALLEEPEYLWVSQYALQLEQYLERFDRDRVLICSSEQLGRDRAAVLAQVHAFVGVDVLPETGTSVSEEWYRGADRRRRGRVASVLADRGLARTAFQGLPEPVRSALRRVGSKPVAGDARDLSQDTRDILRERLLPDIRRFAQHAPEVVAPWGLLD